MQSDTLLYVIIYEFYFGLGIVYVKINIKTKFVFVVCTWRKVFDHLVESLELILMCFN